jgi:hypothetical protein
VARNYPLLIGACGWIHSDWFADFYPQDLPADWCLSYYANEFPVVLVTSPEWRLAEAAATQWCEDTDTSFHFVVEIAANTVEALQLQLDRMAGFGKRCAGILLRTSLSMEVTAISGLLDVINGEWPICLDFGGDNGPGDTVLPLLRERQIGWCWHGEGSAEGLAQGALAVTRIHSKEANPRQIRHWVETALMNSTQQRRSILLFEGEPPDIAMMRQAQIILDLL